MESVILFGLSIELQRSLQATYFFSGFLSGISLSLFQSAKTTQKRGRDCLDHVRFPNVIEFILLSLIIVYVTAHIISVYLTDLNEEIRLKVTSVF